MIQLWKTIRNLMAGQQSKARRRTSTVAYEGVMQLEARRMLSADVSAQIIGGTLFLDGSAAGSRSLTIERFQQSRLGRSLHWLASGGFKSLKQSRAGIAKGRSLLTRQRHRARTTDTTSLVSTAGGTG